MSWSAVINQSRVKDILFASLTRGRLAHAYLFSGPEGVGKFSMALELAKALNCDRSSEDACGVCKNCMMFETLQHPNLHLIFPLPVGKNERSVDLPLAKLSDDEISFVHEQIRLKARNPYHTISIPKANNIKINSIREVRKESSLTAYGKGKKIFVLLSAEKMTDEASNSLLKTLEEPHEDTVLILTTAYPDALLQTIVSRCQHIRFESLSEESIQQALVDREGIDLAEAREIALLSNGSYAQAVQFKNSDLYDRLKESAELLRTMLYKPRKTLLSEIQRITAENQKAEIKSILNAIQKWFRDAKMLEEKIDNVVKEDDKESLVKFITHYPGWNYEHAVESVDRSISLLDKNVYIPLILMDLTFKLKRYIAGSVHGVEVRSNFVKYSRIQD